MTLLTQQNTDLRGELQKAKEQMKAVAEKAARDLAAEREHHAQTVATLQSGFVAKEAAWHDERYGLETKIADQFALMRIWREVIADLRMRLRMLQVAVFFFMYACSMWFLDPLHICIQYIYITYMLQEVP